MTDFIYDIEVYPNVFTMTVLNADTEKVRQYQIGHGVNDLGKLLKLVQDLKATGARMIGFNNFHYDYPILHHICLKTRPNWSISKITNSIYKKNEKIFANNAMNRSFDHVIWENAHLVEQVDLFKIHHFDNKAKMTSLKALEIAMCSSDVRDLPFKPGTELTEDQTVELLSYNKHDVVQTFEFYKASLDEIRFREELSARWNKNVMNHNDTKIGQTYFTMCLEQKKVPVYEYTSDGKREPRQTKRGALRVSDLLFDYIEFKRPEFQAVHNWLNAYVIAGTKEVLTKLPVEQMGELAQYADMKLTTGKVKELNTVVDGFKFVFGTGGLHGCVPSQTIKSDDQTMIIDLDVVSYYPSIAIVNKLYPEHLGEKYVDIYRDIKAERKKHAKKTTENAMLKLALNGIYGKSNDKFSPFYDPKYTMQVTINGQLMLCMLSEMLLEVDSVSMVQANTDGITIKCAIDDYERVLGVSAYWELLTGLELESVPYSRMFIRDVNNYIAEDFEGGLKRKGAYEYEIQWHQNPSALVVKKAAEAFLVHGVNIREFIIEHDNDFDFLCRVKVPRSSRLEYREGCSTSPVQNITRYYITKTGGTLIKVMPPLKGKTEEREFNVEKNEVVILANNFTGVDRSLLKVDWYVEQAYKLIEPMLEREKQAA